MSGAPCPLELDFSGRRPWPGYIGWVLLAVGLALAGLVALDLLGRQAALGEREAVVERLRTQARRSAPLAAAAPIEVRELKPALRVADELHADWGALFLALTAADSDDVGLLGVSADAGRGTVSLNGEARRLSVAFDYLGRLGGVAETARPAGLRDARMDGYELARSGAAQVVRFQVTGQWGAPR
jgi:hypothetical protein